MLNDGFQYLEQRDASDHITKSGVVSKKSAFATSDNKGIYDVIAEDLRWLKSEIDNISDPDGELESIKMSVESMYNEMKTNPNWGETAAKAQAEEALKQAQAAAASAASAKEYSDKASSVATAVTKIEEYLKTIDTLENNVSDNATIATNRASSASTSATNAKTSEMNAEKSETNAKGSEASAKAWATSAGSPDGAADSDSATGKTQSARTWALAAKASTKKAQDAAVQATSTLKNAAATVKAAVTGSSRIYMWNGDKGYPLTSVKDVATNKVYDATYCRLSTTKPTEVTDIWLKPVS